MTNAQKGVAVLKAAQQHLHAVSECIDYLSQVNASAALRTLAVRLQELSLRVGESCDAPAMADCRRRNGGNEGPVGCKWRVNMSKFLLTVCAFGLLLSPAFAEDKTPERLREERSHIFGIEGLENQTFTRFVASGAKLRIGFFHALNPDCTAIGNVNVRVTKQPEHGTVEITAATNFPGYPKEHVRFSNRPFGVKRFQTIHLCGFDVAHGLALLL
jgi:hypothetical protein